MSQKQNFIFRTIKSGFIVFRFLLGLGRSSQLLNNHWISLPLLLRDGPLIITISKGGFKRKVKLMIVCCKCPRWCSLKKVIKIDLDHFCNSATWIFIALYRVSPTVSPCRHQLILPQTAAVQRCRTILF
jgi:hypothetical protein